MVHFHDSTHAIFCTAIAQTELPRTHPSVSRLRADNDGQICDNFDKFRDAVADQKRRYIDIPLVQFEFVTVT